MKKALAMGLGALLLAGSAVPASAASQIDFSGLYRLYFSNFYDRNFASDKGGETNWSGFYNRLQLDFNFQATDEVAVIWRLRAPAAQMWGGPSGGTGATTAATVHAYGEVKQDWGKVSIGKLRADYFYTGLSNLGWRPAGAFGSTDFTAMNPFDIADAEFDGIRYANRWDNGFQLVGQFNRLATGQTNNDTGDEEFTDFYLLESGYFWDGGGATLGLHYLRDHASPNSGRLNAKALKVYYLNPAVSHRFDNGFGIHFEGKAGLGTDDNLSAGPQSKKVQGYAAYLDVDYNYGPGNINLAGWWASGDDGDTTSKRENVVGMGYDFKPLLVAYGSNINRAGTTNSAYSTIKGGAVAMANARSGAAGARYAAGFNTFTEPGRDQSNHWAIALNGNHALTNDIKMTYAIAKLSLNEAVPNQYKNSSDKDIGYEADLSFQIQLLDNLKFGTGFGYLFAGDALKMYADDDPPDAYTWLSTLTFSF